MKSHSNAFAFVAAAVATIGIAFFVGAADGSVVVALVLASTAGLMCIVLFRGDLAPHGQPVCPDLGTTRAKLLASRHGHEKTLRYRTELRLRLSDLQTRMRSSGIAAYAPRIERVDAALAVLDRQIAVDRRLRDSYDRNINMVEIELESALITDAIESTPELLAALSELSILEESQAELTRQLTANVEVEELLSSGR